MRVDISIDSGRDPSVTATPTAETRGTTAETRGTAVTDPLYADAIDAGPPSASLLAEIAEATGGDGPQATPTWLSPRDGRAMDALDAGSSPG